VLIGVHPWFEQKLNVGFRYSFGFDAGRGEEEIGDDMENKRWRGQGASGVNATWF
jgi:hypothetical protein